MSKIKLLLDQSVLTYTGQFSQPAFALWKRDRLDLVEAVYMLFRNHNVGLDDIGFSSDGENFEDDSISVSVENMGDFTLKMGGIECSGEGLSHGEQELFFEMLGAVNSWLVSSVPGLAYSSHYVDFGGHGKLERGTAQDYLHAFNTKRLSTISSGLASGLIFNWTDPNSRWRSRLELDHSWDVPGGLFLHWLVMIEQDQIDVKTSGLRVLSVMKNALAEVGLEVEEAV